MNQNKPLSNLIWTVFILVMSLLLAWSAFQAQSSQGDKFVFPRNRMEILRADGSKAAFDIEVATTPEQQEHGLMFRKKLAADAGMLFLWPEDQPVSMWMKNTLIPLDMLYVAHDGRITKITAKAVPMDLTVLPSDGPIRAVVEIGGGEAARQNIKTGDKVLFSVFSGAS